MVTYLPAFRAIQKALLRHSDYLKPLCERNQFALQFLERKTGTLAIVAAAGSAANPQVSGGIVFPEKDDVDVQATLVGSFDQESDADMTEFGEEEDRKRGVDFFAGPSASTTTSNEEPKSTTSSRRQLDDVDDLHSTGAGAAFGDDQEAGLEAFMTSFSEDGGWAAPTE